MPYSRRTGKRYAAGSSTTLGGWEPKVCCRCGGKIVVSGRLALRFYRDDRTGQVLSWHTDCGSPFKAVV